MAQMNISTRNLDAVVAKLRRYGGDATVRAKVVIEESADHTYQTAQALCPVATGRMKSRMRKRLAADGLGYQMGFWAEDFPEGFYPLAIEFGTRFTTAQPCIFPAGEAERPRFRRALAEALSPRR